MKSRSMFALALTLLSATTVIGPGSAKASMTVIGTGDARFCYLAARTRNTGISALRRCDQALESQPLTPADRVATFTNRGILRMLRNDVDGAIADYDSAIAMNDRLGEPFVNKGIAYLMRKDEEAAVDLISQGIARAPEQLHIAYYSRAMAFEGMGKVPEAYYDYRKALELAPDFAEAQRELARFSVVPGNRPQQ